MVNRVDDEIQIRVHRSATIRPSCCQRNLFFSVPFRDDGGVAAAIKDCNLRVDICVQIGGIVASRVNKLDGRWRSGKTVSAVTVQRSSFSSPVLSIAGCLASRHTPQHPEAHAKSRIMANPSP